VSELTFFLFCPVGTQSHVARAENHEPMALMLQLMKQLSIKRSKKMPKVFIIFDLA